MADLKSAVRRSLSAQVLLGRELATLKKELGFSHGRNQWTPQVAVSKNWGEWCKTELDISDDTANRWIRCYERALDLAKRKKAQCPEALTLLKASPSDLSAAQLTLLADCVHQLVTGETQAGLLAELKMVKPSEPTPGGDTSGAGKGDEDAAFDQMATDLFSEITRKCGVLKKTIFNTRNGIDYRVFLAELPIQSEDGKPSLMSIKRELEEVFNGDLANVLKDVEAAIQNKMPTNPGRRKLTTR